MYHISIVENHFGVMSFEMTDYNDVVKCSSVEGCLNWFNIDTSEENIRHWAAVASQNYYKSKVN